MGDSNADFVAYVKEQLASIRHLTSARFFGGIGMAAEGVQFAMVMDNALYFVVDAGTRPRYEALGSTCFNYMTKKGRVDVHRYFEVPAIAIEEPERLVALAHEAIDAARRIASTKIAKTKPAKSKRA